MNENDLSIPVLLERKDAESLGEAGELAHWHGSLEIVVVERGRLVCHANDDELVLTNGDICFINRRQLHRLTRAEHSNGSAVTLVIGQEAIAQSPELRERYVRPVLEDGAFTHLLVGHDGNVTTQVHECVEKIERLMHDKPLAFELEVVAVCHQIFRLLFIALAERDGHREVPDPNVALVERMIEFIHTSYSEDVRLSDIAASGGVSESTCSRLFKRYTGRTPVSYLIDHRVQVAAQMLRSTRETVSRISQACGFSQQSYFNRLFMRTFGITPREYRLGQTGNDSRERDEGSQPVHTGSEASLSVN